MLLRRLMIVTIAGTLAFPLSAAGITFVGSSGDLAASVDFEVNGTNLVVTLTNTSVADVQAPADVLTAVFFDLRDDPSLTPVSAFLGSGSVVYFGLDGGGNVGGEWAYRENLSNLPEDWSPPHFAKAARGISSTGLDWFGPDDVFPSPAEDLDWPVEPNGLNYGLLSAGDDTTTGNSKVTGGGGNPTPLIKNSVVFTLSGLPDAYNIDAAISKVVFQYGTDVDAEPYIVRMPGTTGQPPDRSVPEPVTMLGVLLGLGGLAGYCRRRFA